MCYPRYPNFPRNCMHFRGVNPPDFLGETSTRIKPVQKGVKRYKNVYCFRLLRNCKKIEPCSAEMRRVAELRAFTGDWLPDSVSQSTFALAGGVLWPISNCDCQFVLKVRGMFQIEGGI